MDSISIGLDIGSSAVRAAEVEVGGGRRVLRRYAQVGLPHGYVVDGEVINIPGVSAALRRLWLEGGFSSNKVVLGICGPRVFVRQADVPALNDEELKSALKFDSQELVPIPMEDASFDFTVLDRTEGAHSGDKQTMRILLVAAHRELLRSHMAALKGAGLTPSAVDATPLALMRIAPPADNGTGVEVLVSIGAELTTVSVRQAGVPRFIRSLTLGGTKLTETIANTMHLEFAVAERLKRGAVPDGPHLAQARKAMSVELRDLAEDVRATVDFFTSQGEGTTVDRLWVTGGAAQTEGLLNAIGGSLSSDIRTIDPFAGMSIGDTGLDQQSFEQASATAASAVGLALWPVESSLIRLSVLPEEIAAARRARRIMSVAACGVAGVAGLLGVVGVGEVLAVHSAQHQLKKTQAEAVALNAQKTQLSAATAVHGEAQARAQLVVTALQGDVDWVRLLGQLAAVMPPTLHLTTFGGARTSSSPVSGSRPSQSQGSGVGTLTFAVQGSGGLPAAAAWLEGLQRDHSLQGTWISGISVTANGGTVTFSSTSNITEVAQSDRNKAVQP